MADPLSISASIAGLIALADTAFRRTFKYVKAVKNAPKEISALSSELGVLYGLLNSLNLVSCQLETESFSSAVQGHHLHSCYLTLEKVKIILDKHDFSSLEDQTMQKLKKRLKWPFSISDAKSLVTEIERHKSTISLALNADGMSGLLLALSRQADVSTNMQDIKREFQQRRETETRIAIDGERQRALDAIGPIEPHKNHEMGLRLRHPATGLWFTEGDDFNTWLNTSGAKLWLYGIPGAGKTVLASSIIQVALAKTSRHVALAYFYCDYKDLAMQQPTNILGSLARQIATQDEQSFEKLQAFYAKHVSASRGSTMCGPTDLCELIVDMASFFDCTMIIVDALDECGTQTASVVTLLTSLNHPGESNTVKTLFLSRDEIDIRELLKDYAPVAIAARTSDLRLYVGAEIELRIRNKQLRIKDQTLKEYIMERLVDGAEGMFRWVVCQMDYLCELTNDAARRKALNSLPPTLSATYERILRRVNNSSNDVQKLVQRCLRWIVHSNGELSIAELCEAISINNDDVTLDREAVPEEDEILRRCSSLIRKSASTSGLELAHYTVKEFLMSVNRDSDCEFGIYHIDPMYDDPELAVTCLTYLSLHEFAGCGIADVEMLGQRATEFAFRIYAVTNWAYHARSHLTNADVFSLAKKLLDPSKPNIFLSWAQEFVDSRLGGLPDHSLLSGSNPLHYAAMLALPEICSWLLGCGCEVDDDSEFGRPLHCAIIGARVLEGPSHKGDWYSFFGKLEDTGISSTHRESTIRVILAAGANPKNYYHLHDCRVSPLHLAVFEQNRTLCRELIQHGATLEEGTADLLRRWSKSDFEEIQALASITDQFAAPETLALRFLASVFTLTTATDSSRSLRIAAEFGQLGIVKKILQDGKVVIDAVDESTGRTSLHYAAKAGHVEIVQRLIECGADCNAKDLKSKTSLHYSVRREGSQCLKLLLQQDIDIAARDLKGYSVWHSAAKRDNAQALSLLQDWVVNKNTSSSPEVDREMTSLNEGLDLRTHTGLTPLHVAVGACALEAVRFFVDNGSDVGAVTANGSTVLHCLASSKVRDSSCEIVGILLAKGADPCQPCMDGKTPLHVLTEWGHQFEETMLEVLQRLAHSATALDQVNAEGMTVLHQVCHLKSREGEYLLDKRTKALKTLLLNGADQKCLNQSGETAFQLVVDVWEVETNSSETPPPEFVRTCSEMADLLLHSNPVPPRHLLFLSLWYHLEELADRLLVHSPEFDTSAYEVSGVTPLQAACYRGCSLTLLRKLLRSHKVQTNNRARGSGLIRLACQSYDSRVLITVTELLDSGLDPNEFSSPFHFHQGETALMIAAAVGNLRLIELLLSRGADPSAKNKEGKTMLHYACEHSYMSSVFEFILNHTCEADINARGRDGKTVLFYAASLGWTHQVSLLLLRKADMTIGDSRKGRLPIHIAASFGELGVVMELLDHGCPIEVKDKSGLTPELTAYKCGHFDVGAAIGSYAKEHVNGSNQTIAPKVAVDHEPDVPSKALKVAIKEGDLDLCQKLVEHGENLDSGFWNCPGCTPLLYSLHKARPEISKYLVLQGASIAGETCTHLQTVGYTAFHYAAVRGYLELLRELLKRRTGISLQRLNPNPVHLAIQNGHTECAQMLIEHAEKGETEDLTATTSLHLAAVYGNVKVTELLLNSGDSPMCLDSFQSTPLHLAALFGHSTIVKILLRAGASPHAVNLNLETPCMMAALSDDLNSLKALVEAGASLTTRDVNHNTLLHRTVASPRASKAYAVAFYIMTKTTGYKLQLENDYGVSVIWYMLKNGYPLLTTFLLNCELDTDTLYPRKGNCLTAATLNDNFPPKMLRVLLRRVPNGLLPILLTHISAFAGTPLYTACTIAPLSSQNERIQILLDAGADIEHEGGEHGTPLMGACAAGRLSVVKLLVMKGANICYWKDREVYSAFQMAKHFPEIRRWLLVGRYTDGPRLLTDGGSIQG